MKTRIYIALLIILPIFIMLKWGYLTKPDMPKEEIYLNLSTELIGILITTILIDWLIERKKTKEEATKIAWNSLTKLKYAAWIWLGSSRDQSINSLANYLKNVDNNDKIAPTTQNLLIQIAIIAEETIILNRELIKKHSPLQKALKELIELKKLRDDDKNLSPQEAASHMINAILNFSLLIKYDMGLANDNYTLKKLSSPEKQEWRMFGELTL